MIIVNDIDFTFWTCEAQCDKCRASMTVDSTNYTDIKEQLRNAGWIIKYIDGDWYEFCSIKCMKEFINNN